MKYEERVIKSSFAAGVSDIVVGLIMYATGWHTWYFEHFHFFGVLGFGMVLYAIWHWYFYKFKK